MLLVALAVLPVFGLVIYNASDARRQQAEAVGSQVTQLAELTGSSVAQVIAGQRQLLVAMSRHPAIMKLDAAECNTVLADLMAQYPFYTNLGATAPDGRVICSAVPQPSTTNTADRAYFQRALAGNDFALGDYQIGRITGQAVVVGAYPLVLSGNQRGIVFASLNLRYLQDLLAGVQLPPDAAITIFDRNGIIVVRYPDPDQWVGQSLPDAPVVEAALSQKNSLETIPGVDGISRLYAFSSISSGMSAGLHVAVGLPTAAAYASVWSSLALNLLAVAAVGLMALAAAWFGSSAFVLRPVNSLLAATRRLAAGDLAARTGASHGASELDQLSEAFDQMAAALAARALQLNRVNRSLKMLSECNQALVRASDETSLLQAVCANIVQHGGFALAWVELAGAPTGELHVAAAAGAGSDALEDFGPGQANSDDRQRPAALAQATGEIVRVPAAWPLAASANGHTNPSRAGVLTAIPIRLDGTPLGALCLGAEALGAASEDDPLLGELASDLAYGLTALRTRAARDHAEAQVRANAERMHALNLELEERVAERTRQLEDTNQVLQAENAERRRAEAALQQALAELEDLYQHAPCGYHSLDANGIFVRANDYELRLFGYSREELLGTLGFADILSPESLAVFRENFPRFLETGRVHNLEFEVVRRDGQRIPVLVSASALHDAAGHFVMSRSTLIDIADRKQAEARIQELNAALQARAAALEAANRELESFSYSVSHDLRAPLRSIDGFSLALLEDYGAQLDGQAQDYLRRVRSAAQRMAALIDDLLNLSRVSRSELRWEEVDLSGLAHAIAQELQQAEPSRSVQFSIQPGLVARGDSRLLRLVLENLIGNAWKFTSRRVPAVIEIGAQADADPVAFYVRDNGAGFDMAYAQRLFGAFQRLHDQSEYAGTGIGLATVQRIINRHQGRVWAESQVGAGATFYFTLVTMPDAGGPHRELQEGRAPNPYA
jgi:PAS domain S-box-containing protein